MAGDGVPRVRGMYVLYFCVNVLDSCRKGELRPRGCDSCTESICWSLGPDVRPIDVAGKSVSLSLPDIITLKRMEDAQET